MRGFEYTEDAFVAENGNFELKIQRVPEGESLEPILAFQFKNFADVSAFLSLKVEGVNSRRSSVLALVRAGEVFSRRLSNDLTESTVMNCKVSYAEGGASAISFQTHDL